MKNILILPILALLISSCNNTVKEIEWEVDKIPPKLVVEGLVTNEHKHHRIILTQSGEYFANKPAVNVSGATISLTGDGMQYMFHEKTDSAGIYESEEMFSGKPGSVYNLEINLSSPLSDIARYNAESKLIEGMQINEVEAISMDNPFSVDDSDSLIMVATVSGTIPSNINNYFLIHLYRNGIHLTDTIDEVLTLSDEEIDIEDESRFFITSEEEFAIGDTLGIEIQSISREYFDFLKGIEQLSQGADPFGFTGPPANAIGNVNDGKGLGYFRATHVSRTWTIIKKEFD